MGSFPMIVGYFLTIFSSICSFWEFLDLHTLSIFSPMTAALHVVDLILNVLFLHCGYLGGLAYYFISSEHWYLKPVSYNKKHQEQAEALTKQYHQSINSGSLF